MKRLAVTAILALGVACFSLMSVPAKAHQKGYKLHPAYHQYKNTHHYYKYKNHSRHNSHGSHHHKQHLDGGAHHSRAYRGGHHNAQATHRSAHRTSFHKKRRHYSRFNRGFYNKRAFKTNANRHQKRRFASYKRKSTGRRRRR